MNNNLATEKDLKAIDKEVRKEVDEAAEKCKAAPRPSEDKLYANILNDDKCGFVRRTTLDSGKQFPN